MLKLRVWIGLTDKWQTAKILTDKYPPPPPHPDPLTVWTMKNVTVLTEDGAFALFFRPHPGGFDSSRVPTPGNLPSRAKKMLMPGGQPGGGEAGRSWNWLMHKGTV